MGFADHPYCVVLQTHDPDSTDSAQESAYADEVLVLALTHSQDDGKIIRGKLMINGDAKRLARALLATDFRDAIRGAQSCGGSGCRHSAQRRWRESSQ